MRQIVQDLQVHLQGGFRDVGFAAQSLAFPALAMLGQQATLPAGVEVPIYPNHAAITTDQRKVKWTRDPRGGKLDVVKHPRFFAEAILFHPDYADDCDGFACHRECCIFKSKLAEEVWHAVGLWQTGGHAVCVYKDKGQWWWVSNWHGCEPMPIPNRDAFRIAMAQFGTPRTIRNAALWPVLTVMKDDSVLYGPPVIL